MLHRADVVAMCEILHIIMMLKFIQDQLHTATPAPMRAYKANIGWHFHARKTNIMMYYNDGAECHGNMYSFQTTTYNHHNQVNAKLCS